MSWGHRGLDLFVRYISQMLSRIEIWEIWRSSQHLELVAVFFRLSLNSVCSVSESVILLKEDSVLREHSGHEEAVRGLRQCLGRCYVSK